MNRRGFLGAMLGAVAAPAVVKAENLMKIIVPKRTGIIFWPERRILLSGDFDGDVLNWGNMVWKPELIRVLPTVRTSTKPLIIVPSL
jgi:hypothetical protein